MPRKAFVADLQEVIQQFSSPNITDLKAGGEDGSVTFLYKVPGGSAQDVTVQAFVPGKPITVAFLKTLLGRFLLMQFSTDLGDYPSSHEYYVYTDSANVPAPISSALQEPGPLQGLVLSQMLSKIVKLLDKATSGSEHNPVDLDDPMDVDEPELEQESDPESEQYDGDSDPDIGGWSPRSPQHHTQATVGNNRKRSGDQAPPTERNRIRLDLRAAKEAGFRVGHLGGLLNGAEDAFVTISCRVAKLGISNEALQAWHLEPSQYFILLIRYTAGYRSLERLVAKDTSGSKKSVEMRVGLSQEYKIKYDEAIEAFSQTKDKRDSKDQCGSRKPGKSKTGALGRLFIGRPLDELMNGRLLDLIKYRVSEQFPWAGAEQFYNDNQGRNLSYSDAVDTKYWIDDASKLEKSLPSIVTADHLIPLSETSSFPLVAMQFALRHLVRCTEFCLVCHCKVEADFEALKPYVCDKSLCLYQYMALGFGPSIEHEIMSQPHVVDLLVSFCYCSAYNRKLASLPGGMGLMVPPPPYVSFGQSHSAVGSSNRGYPPAYPSAYPYATDGVNSSKPANSTQKTQEIQKHKARFDRNKMELIFPSGVKSGLLRAGHWICVIGPRISEERLHCRVNEALYPTVRLGQPIVRSFVTGDKPKSVSANGVSVYEPPHTTSLFGRAKDPQALTPATTPPPLVDVSSYPEVEFVVYDQNFDDLDDIEKQGSLCSLLDTLPSIKQMKDYLETRHGKDMSLRTWTDRLSPAALGVLRWIIASNRSCIVQVDNIDEEPRKAEERVSGMSNWMQFRFAQGAPDKEQRFVTAVRETTDDLPFPTMFAWHGSPLHNWHGIVREGLHFQHTAHGRAFGNGVYHSLQAATSLGYTGGGHFFMPGSIDDGMPPVGSWPHSELRISQALTLNEIVNAPHQFVSCNPHLVVAQLDWIQSRYLFVRCNMQTQNLGDKAPSQVYEQDPKYTPVGAGNEKIVIPITVISKSRRPVPKAVKSGNKKAKINASNPTEVEDALLLSDDTDAEDLEIFFSEDEATAAAAPQPQPSQSTGKMKAVMNLFTKAPEIPETDFIPGTLDHKSLPLLEPPAYATSSASKQLQRELTATLRIQDTHPTHELGWYINPELISNVYQWIIQLHSFEAHLPLSRDMKAKELKSVVMEMRFGKDYPMSPPFVRIIRPRFLSFTQGGGGHVTAGGALCMELLTNSGWSAVSNIESVLLQVRLAISSTDPKPARLEPGPVKDYGAGEAVEAYIRACQAHGVSFEVFRLEESWLTGLQWEVPKDFRASYSAIPAGSNGRV